MSSPLIPRQSNGDSGGDEGDGQGALPLGFPLLPLDAVNEAVDAAIPKKLGDREYWGEWAKDIGQTATRLIIRIEVLIGDNPQLGEDFARFLKGLEQFF